VRGEYPESMVRESLRRMARAAGGPPPKECESLLDDMRMTEAEFRLLCHLMAQRVGEDRYDVTTCDALADRLFARCWTAGSGMAQLVKAAAGFVTQLGRGRSPDEADAHYDASPAATAFAFTTAKRMYEGDAEPRSAKALILYAEVMQGLGRLDAEGNPLPEEEQDDDDDAT
jgi:hypothetical protein